MPEASHELRKLFMINGEDGVANAEAVIKKAGGKITQGLITAKEDQLTPIVNNAIMFLIYEWDYGFEKVN